MLNKISLVTGGAGFIGSHMVDLLIKKNHKVIVIDNLAKGKISNLKKHIKKIKFIKKDICSLKFKDLKVKKIDYIFHFAGEGSLVPSITDPKKYMKVNFTGTLNLLEETRNINYKKFIYAASSSCYGKASVPTNEKNKIDNLHPYALSKYLGEKLCLSWNKIYKKPINSVRIFNAYGERIGFNNEYGAAFPIFLKQKMSNKPLTIVGDGKQKRDFIYVKDLVKGFYEVAKIKKSGEIFNIGSGNPVSINKLASLIGGKKTYIAKRPGEPYVTHASIIKIKKYTKWRPKINISEGTRVMLNNMNYWKKSPLWDKTKITKATKIWFKKLS